MMEFFLYAVGYLVVGGVFGFSLTGFKKTEHTDTQSALQVLLWPAWVTVLVIAAVLMVLLSIYDLLFSKDDDGA